MMECVTTKQLKYDGLKYNEGFFEIDQLYILFDKPMLLDTAKCHITYKNKCMLFEFFTHC